MITKQKTIYSILIACIITGISIGVAINRLQHLTELEYRSKITTELAYNLSRAYRLTLQEAERINPPQVVGCHYYYFIERLTIDRYHYLYYNDNQIWVYNSQDGTAYTYHVIIKRNGQEMEWSHR